jgi:hypothetical protein
MGQRDYTVSPYTRSIFARVVSNRMTVGEVLYFADLLREKQVPLRELVGFSRSDEGHFTGMSVSYSETLSDGSDG